jgi:TetR/AcrR family transcriptional regulator
MARWPAAVFIDTVPLAGANAFDRKFQAKQRRDALFQTATVFFNHNGFDNSSLDDIVASLKVSKGGLYHYVANKEELLFGCYSRSLNLTGQILNAIERAGGSALEMEARFMSSMIALNAGPHGPLAGYFRLQSLTPAHQREVRTRSNTLIRQSQFSERGYADHSIRKLNGAISRRAIVGSLNWIPRWYSPAGPSSPADVSDSFCSLFINGLVPRR